jgi:tetratricopeptide (TPR) repeat protein
MLSDERVDLDVANATAYEDLVAAIEASDGVLSLLLAVCDDPQLQEATIRQYEAELQPKILPFRIEIPRTEPSLRRAIAEKIAQEHYLQSGGRAVLTVVGAEGLSFLTLGDEKSEQDRFLGYLQWTREALRAFQYPIVLWVTSQLLAKLSRKAPDFWSWRKDVFRFDSKKTATVSSQEIEPLRPVFESLGLQGVTEDDSIPLEDLRQLITQTEARLGDDRNDKLLATLYERMGSICASRIEQGESIQYQAELQEALDYFRKAAEIQTALSLETDFATSLGWQGYLYESQGCYSEAESLYLRSLEIKERQLGADHPDVATSLNNLAALYQSQGRYSEAESLYVRSLEIRERQLGADHPNVAASLNNLAALYRLQGRYSEAEPLYVRSLEIWERQLGADHPSVATSLNNLALLYASQGRYSEAEPLCVRSLEIREHQLGTDHPDVATSLNNLAWLYTSQGRYSEAEPFYVRSLEIWKRQLGTDHPNVASSLNNLAELYCSQGRYSEAEPLYIEGLRILSQLSEKSGVEHPNLQAGLQNFQSLVAQVIQAGRQAELSDRPETQALLKQLPSNADAGQD